MILYSLHRSAQYSIPQKYSLGKVWKWLFLPQVSARLQRQCMQRDSCVFNVKNVPRKHKALREVRITTCSFSPTHTDGQLVSRQSCSQTTLLTSAVWSHWGQMQARIFLNVPDLKCRLQTKLWRNLSIYTLSFHWSFWQLPNFNSPFLL